MVTHAPVAGGVLAADLLRPVGRRVVTDDQLKISQRLGQDRIHRLGQITLPVIDRKRNAHLGFRLEWLHESPDIRSESSICHARSTGNERHKRRANSPRSTNKLDKVLRVLSGTCRYTRSRHHVLLDTD